MWRWWNHIKNLLLTFYTSYRADKKRNVNCPDVIWMFWMEFPVKQQKYKRALINHHRMLTKPNYLTGDWTIRRHKRGEWTGTCYFKLGLYRTSQSAGRRLGLRKRGGVVGGTAPGTRFNCREVLRHSFATTLPTVGRNPSVRQIQAGLLIFCKLTTHTGRTSTPADVQQSPSLSRYQ